MNISRFIKKLLNKEDNTYIINMQDTFVLPERNSFNDNKEMLNLIDKQKEEYLNVLKNKKLFFTKDLSNTLKEEILIKVDIILNEFLKSENKTLDTRVFISKLMLYMNDLINYEKEVLSNAVALKEIINEKILLSKNKKELLNNELNNLLNSLVILNSQKSAINNRINSYKTEYIYEKHEFDIEEINNRYEYLCYLKDKEIEQIDETQKIVAIALMEKELEEYAYKNADKTKEIKNDIYYMNYYNLGINKYNVKEDIEEYEEHKKIIEKDERQVLIFKEFGKNLISEETVESFYRKKLEILTFNIFNQEYINISKEDKGYSYYLKIVEEKLNDFVFLNSFEKYEKKLKKTYKILYESGTSIYDAKKLIKHDFKEKNDSLLKLFKDLLNSLNNNYENLYRFILIHSLYLALLLSLENEEELKLFFEKYNVNYKYAILMKTSKPFEVQELISLKTAIELTKNDYLAFVSHDNQKHLTTDKIFKDLCNIYNKYNFKNNFNNFIKLRNYKIPEGIVKIYESFSLKKDLLNDNKQKDFIDIILPSSLESLPDIFFNDTKIDTLYLNENLKYIYEKEHGLIDEVSYNIKHIKIHSSLEDISRNIFKNNKSLESITFYDFKDSIYLKEHLDEFIDYIMCYDIQYRKVAAEFRIKHLYLMSDNKKYIIDLSRKIDCTDADTRDTKKDLKNHFIEEVKKVTGYNLEENKQIKTLNK